MKVFALVGSNRKSGRTAAETMKLARTLDVSGTQTVICYANEANVAACTGCNYCRTQEGCSQTDGMQRILQEIINSDAVIISSPVYFGNLSGQLKIICDRMYPAYRGGGRSLFAKKKLYLIYTQHSACDIYVDFRKTAEDYLFKFLGFHIVETIVVGGSQRKVF
ncbi:MAG: flavodoxin family protein [bacterium]